MNRDKNGEADGMNLEVEKTEWYYKQSGESQFISIDDTGERYHLNHAIVVQTACQTVVCGTMCLQVARKPLPYETHLS